MSVFVIDGMSKQPSVPTDLLDRITAMQNAIDHLTNQIRASCYVTV